MGRPKRPLPSNSRHRKISEIQLFHFASSIFVCILHIKVISLSRNQVQLVACKALLFQHAKDLSSLILIFNLCSIFCSFASKYMPNPNHNLFTTETLQSHHGTHKSNNNSNSTSVLQPTSPPRCSIMSGTGGSTCNWFARLVDPLLTKNGRTPLGNPSRQLEPTVWPAPSCLETDALKAVTLTRAAVSVEMEERMDKKSVSVATIST
jgi:hypothetical protein